ncbi:hypothetical protein [Streptomyces sp. NPDC001530]|uniref:hypothetical protein n=1 Tax=Streptomyces sp. NPDC001530 TaxID=3364582 RepID=UPI0036A14134
MATYARSDAVEVPAEQAASVTNTRPHGKTTAQAWDRLHPRRRAAWIDPNRHPPIIEGTIVRLVVVKPPSA